CARFGRLDYW
nr:immunoglobulin heavy chain junction region [Mus musculus]NSM05887.1 immunoglobulin heavy chain junction region [Mus musculus]NSM08115.1 immunoglobulin heavy chain junction region [Mus musculus]